MFFVHNLILFALILYIINALNDWRMSLKNLCFVWDRILKHPNVSLFYGCLMDVKDQACLYEFCTRGSLDKILQDSEMDLDWIFKVSFIMDIAEGMRYLHSRKVIHGRLSTQCCLVNEQWTIKIQGTAKTIILAGKSFN